jgi:chorismate mutase
MATEQSKEMPMPPAEGPTADQSPAVHPELQRLRDSIDNIDAALIYLLAERFKCTKQVGALKARIDLPSGDPAREAAQIERLRKLAEGAHLDPEFAEKFLAFIIKEVIRHHESFRSS